MDNLEKTIELFRKLPSIGPRQAKRIVYYLLHNLSLSKSLSVELNKLNQSVIRCPLCKCFFDKKLNNKNCKICEGTMRNSETLMIVERDFDMEAVEKSGIYKGLYFIIGGVIPILNKNPEKIIKSEELKQRIKIKTPKELIFALSATPEGEHTVDYLNEELSDIFLEEKIKITILGRGLSTGTELEYADPETLKNAMENRH